MFQHDCIIAEQAKQHSTQKAVKVAAVAGILFPRHPKADHKQVRREQESKEGHTTTDHRQQPMTFILAEPLAAEGSIANAAVQPTPW